MWWKRLLGGSKSPAPPETVLEKHIRESQTARDLFWAAIGRVDSDVLAQAIASRFIADMPVWPSGHESFRIIRTDSTILIATEGLSDPDDGPYQGCNGLGFELFIEAPAVELRHPIGSAYLYILTQTARNLVDAAETLERWRKFQMLSLEIPADKNDQRMVNPDGQYIALLGMPGFDAAREMTGMPLSPVRAMAVTVVHPADFEKVRGEGSAGRTRLAAALDRAGLAHVSDLNRGPAL
jgi:hypothetical protein